MLKIKLETFYRRYNRRGYVHPDPLEFLYAYPDVRDREIVALIASALAYGRVAQILKSVSRVLEIIGPSPRAFLEATGLPALRADFKGFVHRFADGESISALMTGAAAAVREHGSLEACFLSGYDPSDETVLPALAPFSEKIACAFPGLDPGHLIPLAARTSACKRLNLFLRWMVRNDAVDPGGWGSVSPAKLIVPLDTHMHRVGLSLGFTRRKQADIRTALEITAGFRELSPEDPVRYDFALTRPGIRGEGDASEMLAEP
jgi:uncharacterized protein (TIGR02757 family)